MIDIFYVAGKLDDVVLGYGSFDGYKVSLID